jgi:hypothetical protein
VVRPALVALLAVTLLACIRGEQAAPSPTPSATPALATSTPTAPPTSNTVPTITPARTSTARPEEAALRALIERDACPDAPSTRAGAFTLTYLDLTNDGKLDVVALDSRPTGMAGFLVYDLASTPPKQIGAERGNLPNMRHEGSTQIIRMILDPTASPRIEATYAWNGFFFKRVAIQPVTPSTTP